MPRKVENGKVTLTTPSGRSSVTVLQFGATVVSWQHDGAERFFLSRASPLDGSAAVRGGIPIVFPVFGAPTDHEDHKGLEKLPKHGFARTTQWKLADEQKDGQDSASLQLELDSAEHKDIQDVYAWPVQLRYVVTISDDGTLECALHVKHAASSGSPARFHALLHNYLAVPDVTAIGVTGLKGLTYIDKNKDKAHIKEDSDEIVLHGQASDRVYQGSAPDVTLRYNDGSGRALLVTRNAVFADTVVWNPAEAAAKGMKDLHEGGWKEYVCIEPGYVARPTELPAGQEWVGIQRLKIVEGKSKV